MKSKLPMKLKMNPKTAPNDRQPSTVTTPRPQDHLETAPLAQEHDDGELLTTLDLAELTDAIRELGEQANQMAHKANSGRPLSRPEVEALLTRHEQLFSDAIAALRLARKR